MLVTALQAQKKSSQRVSVFVDKKYLCGLFTWQLGDVGIAVGDTITHEKQQELIKASKDGKLYERVVNWCLLRPRSLQEAQQYLMRIGVDGDKSEHLLLQLKQNSFLNNEVFATFWVEQRQKKQFSQSRIRLELQQKGVDKDIIDGLLASSEYTDKTALSALIQKKRRQSRYQDDQKLIGYLSRQGFSYGDIRQAMDEAATD